MYHSPYYYQYYVVNYMKNMKKIKFSIIPSFKIIKKRMFIKLYIIKIYLKHSNLFKTIRE